MRIFIILMTLSLIVTACVTHVTPTSTHTAIPTDTSTPVPAATPKPTATVDPNMPPDAAWKDAYSGEYIKIVQENGKTTKYYWKQIQIGDDAITGVKGHWFESRMVDGPIDLTGYGENNWRNAYGDIHLPLTVYAIHDLHDLDKIGYLYHPDGTSDWVKYGSAGDTLSTKIVIDLFLTYYDAYADGPGDPLRSWDNYLKFQAGPDGTPTPEDGRQMNSDWIAFVSAMNGSGGIHVGDDLWQPRKGYDVLWIGEATAQQDPAMFHSFWNGANAFYWKTLVKNGKLIAVVAAGAPERAELANPKRLGSTVVRRERAFRGDILFLLQALLEGRNSNESGNWIMNYGHYGSLAGPGISVRNLNTGVSFTITTSFLALTPAP